MRYRAVILSWLLSTPLIAVGQGPTPVSVAETVERDAFPSMRLVGTILPERTAVVAAEVEGVVAEFIVEEGQFVRAGEPLCRLDATVANLWVRQAEAELGGLEARLAELENGTREEVLRQLKAAADESQAIFDKWGFERERIAKLFAAHQSSPKEQHDTEMEYLAAERRLLQNKSIYEAAVNGPRKEEIERARFDVATRRATLERLRRDAAKAELRAPFTGFVIAKRTEVGEWVVIGGPVCEMVAMEKVKVRVDVPESAIPFALPPRPASVTIEALRETREGAIARLIPRATQAARTFPIEIDLPNEDHRLLPGMFVWANVPSGEKGRRLMVPRDAIVSQGTFHRIFVVHTAEDGTAMATPLPVEIGIETGGEVEVQAPGLKAGDQVVIRANERLYGPGPVIPISDAPTNVVNSDPTQSTRQSSTAAEAPDSPSEVSPPARQSEATP